ncbi:MAG TPA: F-box protein, partial [Chlamydiales bacterium]|nr:F-box protein [Chlamydiales bacterium]
MSSVTKTECKSPAPSSAREKSKTRAPCSLPPCLVLEVLHNLDPIQGKSKQNLTLVCRQWAHLIVNGITVLTKKYTVAEAWDY